MNAPAELRDVTLDDKYSLERGRVFLTGIQALVRLPMLQRQRDLAAGLNTAGFVSGYRGSPLGGLDQALFRAKKFLDQNHIVFQPGVNEDLAATAIWGSQQVNLFPRAKYDGVFGIWYGKGPGVDRCGDVFRHANACGTSKYGGVIVCAGDDHAAKSSTLPHQTDHIFKAVMMPVLYPASVQEYLDLGVHGYAMSRYSGCWVAFKCVTDVVESSASVYVDPDRVKVDAADRHRAARGRAQHPLARSVPRAGGAAAAPQAVRGARLLPRQQPEPHRHRQPAAAARDHHLGQGVHGRAPGARGPRHRRPARRRDRDPPLQGGHDLAARVRGRAALRAGTGGDPRRRGEAPVPRVPAEGGALQLARGRPAAGHRQVRREGRMGAAPRPVAAARRRRAVAGDRREGDRGADRALPHLGPHQGAARFSRGKGEGAREAARHRAARALLLLRLSAQHLDARARGQPRDRRHRLPLHGGVDGPQHRDLQPHGRRRRVVDRPGAVHRGGAHLRQPRRRDLLPLGSARDPRRGRGEGADHLQDSLQRRGRDDRRAAFRRPAQRADDRRPGCGRRRREDRDRHRRAGEVPGRHAQGRRAGAASRRSRPGAARAARVPRRVGARLRPDLRGGEAPPPQARHLPGSAEARLHQRARVRGLRRLRRAVELRVGRAARDRVRPQAHDQPVLVQQGLLVHEGVLPELRDGRGRAGPPRQGACRRRGRLACPARAAASRRRSPLQHPRHRHRRHRRHHGGRPGRHGRAHRGQGRQRARHDRARAEERRGDVPRAPRRAAGRALLGAHRGGRGQRGDRLRHGRRGRRRSAIQDAGRPHAARGQHRGGADRRVHAQARLAVPRRRYARGARGRSRHFERRLRRRDAARDRADRRRDRDQPVHARLRVPERARSGLRGCDRAGDRAERGGGRGEPESVPLGPSRRARSSRGSRRRRRRRK